MPNDMCNEIFAALPLDLKQWIITVTTELKEAEGKYPKWPKDFVHAAAIVGEESGELVRAANLYAWENGKYYDMHKEAVQTAAMCFRFLINSKDKNV